MVLRLRWLLGDTLIIWVLHMLNRIRLFLGLPVFGGKEEQDWVIENISGDYSEILDIGASESLLRLRLKNTNHRVLSLDVRFLRGIDSKPFILGDAMRLPFRDGVFDYVVLGSAIEHIGLGAYKDPVNQNGDLLAMREVRRVLRKGGHVLITTHYSTEGGVTWQRHYSDVMIERLSEGFVTFKKTYLLNTGGMKQPWRRIKKGMPWVEPTDPGRAIICLSLLKQ